MKVPKKILINLRTNPEVRYIETLKLELLKNVLINADKVYYNEDTNTNESYIPDEVYDIIKDLVTLKDPSFVENELGHNVMKVQGAKVKLPIWMGSMDKKKSISKSLEHVVISDKLDGISCLVHIKKGMTPFLYTRGNGEYGRNISHFVKYFNNIDYESDDEIMIRGELLLKINTFKKYRCEESNARNTVAGFVNAKQPDEKFKNHIDFVAYELIKPEGLTPSQQFDYINNNTKSFKTVVNEYYEKISTNEILSEALNKRKRLSEYEIDGIIVAQNVSYKNVTSGNPKHAFAYKENSLEKRVITTVSKIEWNISKDGYLKPLVYFEPIIIDNVKIQKATGHNAKFIKDNLIGKGSQVLIERSGDVIPKIVSVSVATSADMPDVKYKWNKTNTDIILDDDSNDDDLKKKQFEFVLLSINFDHMGKGIISRLYDNNVRSLKQLYSISEESILNIEGFKKKSAENLYKSIQKRKSELTCLDYMVASNMFGRGLSKKNLEKIIKIYDPLTTNATLELIENIDGIGKVYAKQYVDALPEFKKFLQMNDIDCVTGVEKEHVLSTKGTKLKSVNVIFTGFRSKDLEQCVKNQGGKVTTSLSKKNSQSSILVTKELDALNKKQIVANDYNIKIMTRENFEKMYC